MAAPYCMLVCTLTLSLLLFGLVLCQVPTTPSIDARDTDLLVDLVEGDSSTGFAVLCNVSMDDDNALPLELRWTFNREALPLERQEIETIFESNRTTYTNILDLNVRGTWLEADAGTYGCTARTNDTDEIPAAMTFQLVVNIRPEVLTLEDAQVGLQKTVTLTCTTRATLPLNFTWSRGGTVLQTTAEVNNNNNIFTLTNVSRTDSGNYTCRATNRFGSANSSAVVNVVNQGLPFFARSFRLTVTSNSSQTLILQWPTGVFDGNSPIIGFDTQCFGVGFHRDLHTSRPALIPPDRHQFVFRELHAGRLYACTLTVINALGSTVSQPAFATVMLQYVPDPPTLVQAFPEHGVSGLRLIIWVRLEPNDDVQYYELTYDSVHVDHPIAPETLRVENTGSSAIQVRVQGLRRLTEYRFAVRAVSSHGVASQATSTTATTEAFPIITDPPPETMAVSLGTDITLPCSSEGDPVPVTLWDTPSTSARTLGMDPDGRLVLSNIQPSDAGLYTCTVENVWGSASSTAVITVAVTPTIGSSTAAVETTSNPAISSHINIYAGTGFSIGPSTAAVETTSNPVISNHINIYAGTGFAALFFLVFIVTICQCLKRSKSQRNLNAIRDANNMAAIGLRNPSFSNPSRALDTPSGPPRRTSSSRQVGAQQRTSHPALQQGTDASLNERPLFSTAHALHGPEYLPYRTTSRPPPPPYSSISSISSLSIGSNNPKPVNPPSYQSVIEAEQMV